MSTIRTRSTLTTVAIALAATATAGTAAATAHASVPQAATGVKTRAAVPWNQVGTGWVAADVLRAGKNHLVLASPAGQAYDIATLAANEHVTAISHDGRHVATENWRSADGMPHPRIWDLRTGRAADVPINLSALTFTRPTGRAVMGFNEVNSYGRYSTGGTESLVVTAKHSGVGTVPHLTPNPNGLSDAVTSTSDGRDSVTLYSHARFTKLRTFNQPAGSQGCRAIGWKNSTTLIEACVVKDRSGVMKQQVFAQNIGGGSPRMLTTGTTPGGDPYTGFVDVASTSIGDVAITAQAVAGGRNAEVYRLSGTKATKRVGPSEVNPNGGDYAGGSAAKIVGDKIVYESTSLGGRTTKRMVAEYDVRTKRLTYLVGNNSQFTGEVVGYAVIDPRS